MNEYPPEAYAAALAGLPHLSPRRQLALLHRVEPVDAWAMVLSGNYSPVRAHAINAVLQGEARQTDPGRVWDRCQALGVSVMLRGSRDYPLVLDEDLYPPAVLFTQGEIGLLDRRRVAIVGTRRATALGRALAFELGNELAANGVAVISGLALGIDAAAHRGCLAATDASAIAVVASGHDVHYPKANTELWNEVANRGLLLSEVPPGTLPIAYRFPARNRIIAALCEIVIVVESRESGGSILTVNEAVERERTVMAVPGSPRNPASAGTNLLLGDVATPVTCAADVIAELGLNQLPFRPARESRAQPTSFEQRLLDALVVGPLTLDGLVDALESSVGEVALAAGRLDMAGWVVRSGGCFELLPVAGSVPPSRRRTVVP